MRNLLSSYFYRCKRDTILYLGIGISILFALMNVVVSNVLYEMETMQVEATGRTLYLNSFNPNQNMGVLIPILLIIVFNREYSNGTIRNKIISGYSRTQIYISTYLSNIVFGILLLLVNVLVNLGLGTVFLGYGKAFTASEFLYLLEVALLGCLLYSVFLTIAHLLLHLFKNLGYVIYFAIFLLMGVVSGVDMLNTESNVLKFIGAVNPCSQLLKMSDHIHETRFVVTSLISSIIYIAILLIVGLHIFKKADIK